MSEKLYNKIVRTVKEFDGYPAGSTFLVVDTASTKGFVFAYGHDGTKGSAWINTDILELIEE